MKFRNSNRRSVRLKRWDYCRPMSYFVTICTQGQQHFFGKIEDSVMCLSAIGMIARFEWFQTPKIRPDMNIELGAFVVMPNHIHGIITIGKNRFNQNMKHNIVDVHRRTAMHCGPNNVSPPSGQNRFGPQRKNLASIIRGYKSAVTKHAHGIDPRFSWQSRYYEHIIRNPDAEDAISIYIRKNVIALDRILNS